MNKEVGARIANEINSLITIDASESVLAWGHFLCLKMNIDITKPFMRDKMIHLEDFDEFWVFFKYERLPIFCYQCGILSHHD